MFGTAGLVAEDAGKQVDTAAFATAEFNEVQEEQRAAAEAMKTKSRHLYHRLLSDRDVEELLPQTVEPGDCIHVLSGGDVDALSYLHWVLRLQKVKRMLLSTWCMAITDVDELRRDVRLGKIGCIDFYCGEIFKASYPAEYIAVNELCRETGGRFVIFRNHSKVMAGYGEKFDFYIEGSANVNTNPRHENACITIDTGLVEFAFRWYGDRGRTGTTVLDAPPAAAEEVTT